MSDNLSNLQLSKFKDTVSLKGEPSPCINSKYLRKDDKFAVSLQMTNLFLKNLNKAKEEYGNLTMVDILNSQLAYIKIHQNDRIENRLATQCGNVCRKLKKMKGGKQKIKCEKDIYTMAVFERELVKSSEMNNDERVSQFDSKRVEVEAQCEEIWCSLAEDAVNIPVDSDDLTQRQSRRRLTHIRDKSEKTLIFLKEYGLTPKRLTLSNGHAADINISYSKSSYSKLPEAEKETLRSLVVVLDRFGVSSSAYHEIAQLFPTLPRSHSVINMKNDMTSTTEVKRVPGNVPGAMLSFKHELQKKVAQKLKGEPSMQMYCHDP